MTTMETIEQLKSLLDDRMSFLGEQGNDYCRDIAALTAAIKAVNKPASGGKLYTAFEVIRIVQAAVSDAVCGMGAEESTVVAYEIEREIISKLVQEGANERKSRESEIRRSHTGRKAELQITTASNNSSDVPQTAPD